MSYWWCLTHNRVEPETGCAHMERLGPYETEQEASEALDKARRRNEEWDAVDREDKEWGSTGE